MVSKLRIRQAAEQAAEQAAMVLGCTAGELRGVVLRDAFLAAERCGGVVYWGCWSEAQLDAVIE